MRGHFCNLRGIQTQDHVFAETFAIKKYNGDVLSVITKADIVRTASYGCTLSTPYLKMHVLQNL